jgi:dTDP-4-dehydrorhamnose reductase
LSDNLGIPGLYRTKLPIFNDQRGWFCENWNLNKATNLSTPFFPKQQNVSFNSQAGVTRGFHAEPWDKLISVSFGTVFCAWVDLRKGESFGMVSHYQLQPGESIFVPAGVANAYQALEDNTVYNYLVNGTWDAGRHYTSFRLGSSPSEIPWPIPLNLSVVSEKDKLSLPFNSNLQMSCSNYFVTGAGGQLGLSLLSTFEAIGFDREEWDISDASKSFPTTDAPPRWILNAAAYTKVDQAETEGGKLEAWKTNVDGVINLARTCINQGIGLITFSSDYVFDGKLSRMYTEEDEVSPINFYGHTKATADKVASLVPAHYVLRTSWVFGAGSNFCKFVFESAKKQKIIEVVHDQLGRPTSARHLALAAKFLTESGAHYGLYNFTNSGEPISRYELACFIYEYVGAPRELVRPIETLGSPEIGPPLANRPSNSSLNLDKYTRATSVQPVDWRLALSEYLDELLARPK